jgi:hypothetical protein
MKGNTNLKILTSGGKLSVLTLSNINKALSQSAFRNRECYITINDSYPIPDERPLLETTVIESF